MRGRGREGSCTWTGALGLFFFGGGVGGSGGVCGSFHTLMR